MNFNNSVTVYHKTKNGFIRKYFVRAHIVYEKKLEATDGGRAAKDTLNVRIFTSANAEILPGDLLTIGLCREEMPPENAHIIFGAAKNFGGGGRTRHYRIEAI